MFLHFSNLRYDITYSKMHHVGLASSMLSECHVPKECSRLHLLQTWKHSHLALLHVLVIKGRPSYITCLTSKMSFSCSLQRYTLLVNCDFCLNYRQSLAIPPPKNQLKILLFFKNHKLRPAKLMKIAQMCSKFEGLVRLGPNCTFYKNEIEKRRIPKLCEQYCKLRQQLRHYSKSKTEALGLKNRCIGKKYLCSVPRFLYWKVVLSANKLSFHH